MDVITNNDNLAEMVVDGEVFGSRKGEGQNST